MKLERSTVQYNTVKKKNKIGKEYSTVQYSKEEEWNWREVQCSTIQLRLRIKLKRKGMKLERSTVQYNILSVSQ